MKSRNRGKKIESRQLKSSWAEIPSGPFIKLNLRRKRQLGHHKERNSS